MTRMLAESVDAVVSLVKGLGVTLRQFFRKPVTVQYPEERVAWPARTRGRVVLPKDPARGATRCTACLQCQRICPNGSLEVTAGTHAEGKRAPREFLYHLDRCTFCGLCVETCPFDALRMSHEHEHAALDPSVFKRRLLDEDYAFDPAWQGGLPAKADAASPARTPEAS